MKVGFFLTGRDPLAFVFADRLLRSVRQHMPGVPVVQFTDKATSAVWGVDDVRRKPPTTLSVLRSNHYADVEGDWLFVDTDVILQRDVRSVFDQDFDVAVTDRHTPKVSPVIEEKMPFPAGVVFSRSPAFWKAVHEEVLAQGADKNEWYGDQLALATVIRRGQFRHIVLPGAEYQLPPQSLDEDLSNAAIVHYKGPTRKPFLLQRIQKELSL